MEINFEQIRDKITGILERQINGTLSYHNVGHTREVLANLERIAKEEGIKDDRTLLIMKLAALFHDTGFIYVYKDHEEKSYEFAKVELKGYNISKEEFDIIGGMIMATKIPQSPKNHMEQIICDADLDYLGRDDFDVISSNLKKEVLLFGIAQTEAEWEEKQIHFIESHKYFTETCRKGRDPKKLERLNLLKAKAGLITN
jgi:uncharacterized protein